MTVYGDSTETSIILLSNNITVYLNTELSDTRIITFLMHKFHHAIPLDSCLQEYALLQMIDLMVLLPVTCS